MENARARNAAFTLIEVLLVIGILVVLMGAAIVGYTGIKERADKDTTKILIGQTASAVKLYHAHMNTYPTTDDGLKALSSKPDDEKEAERWSGPYLENGVIPVDPWNNELKYERLDNSDDSTKPPFRVFSYGPDGQEGTDDDISTIKETSGL